jgi:two-component system LytT family sensor kinase
VPGRWRWLGGYFGAWALAAGVYTVNAFAHGFQEPLLEVLHAVAGSLTSWTVRALALLPAVWLAHSFPIRGGRWMAPVLVHVPASVVLGTAKAAACVWLSVSFAYLKPADFTDYLAGDLPFNILSYWAVVGVVHGVDYYRRYREREQAAAHFQLRASRLEAELARAQLDALKMQLQPHFLFNTLHSISALIHEDPEAADLMVWRLSDFLRLVLENVGAQEVPLRQELYFLERYMAIQQTRFQERLRWELEVPPEALDARVPNLVLQPLVENAIRHAVEPRSSPGSIRIQAHLRGGRLVLEVRDDGPGLQPAGTGAGRGLGLANTRARLEHLYGPEQSCTVEEHRDGGVVVRITLPFGRAEGEAGEAAHG